MLNYNIILYFNGVILLELFVLSLSLNSIDTLSGVTDRLFCMLLIFDIGLIADVLLAILKPFVLADFVLDIERGRGTGGILLLPIIFKNKIILI